MRPLHVRWEYPVAGHGLCIYVSPEFRAFAQGEKVDVQRYRRCLEELCSSAALEGSMGIGWTGGLITYVHIPGNAAGLSLDCDNPDEPVYVPHNIDTLSQMSVLFGLMSQYIGEIDARTEYP